jgi:large subunit ribosomal protein L17
MNHRVSQRKLNRTTSHRKAMQRNLVQSLFEHGQIRTTLPKAKDIKPIAERLITLAKRANQGSLIARRRIHQIMGERSMIPGEHQATYDQLSDSKRKQVMVARSGRRHRTGQPKGKLDFTAESVTRRLIETVAPRYMDRPGGYTRLIRLATRRVGDQSFLAIVQLIGDEEAPGSVTKAGKTSRRRKADARYAAAVKAAKGFGASKSAD